MLKKTLVSLAVLLLASNLFAVDAQSLMQAGNESYKAGAYAEAIINYEKILVAEKTSADLHYNLGCAYFNEEYYGQAILHFEKAHQLSPRDEDIQHNLDYSKLFIKDKFDLPQPMPLVAWFMAARSALSLDEIKKLEMILFALLILSSVAFLLTRHSQINRIMAAIVLFSLALLLISGGWLWDRTRALDQKHGVVLVEEVSVTSAPTSGSSTLFVIHEGTSGEILDATDAWYKIRLADGKTGWVNNEVLGIY